MASATDSRYGQKESSDQNFDYMFKILIIGNSSVGKTSFLFRYADDSFTPAFVSTVGIDFKVKTIYRNDKRIKLQIWVGWLAARGSAVRARSLPVGLGGAGVPSGKSTRGCRPVGEQCRVRVRSPESGREVGVGAKSKGVYL